MAHLRAPISVVAMALNSRTEGMGVRAAGRTFGKSHSTILRWEERLANQVDAWSPPASVGREVTLERDEVYTRVSENFPPAGWTIHFIERSSRYWVSAQAGHKDELLFQRGTQQVWQGAQTCPSIRWFTDGERRYAKALWDLASIYLVLRECLGRYHTRKVWREGLEVAM